MPSVADYLRTPVGFALAGLGLKLYPWQERVLWDLDKPGSVALRAANNSGKTSVVGAAACLWHASAFPGSLTICTASVFRQVSEQLFPALHRHAAKFPGGTFNETDVTLANGSKIFGFATDEANRFEGWHSSHLFMLLDESKGIQAQIFEAVERCAPQRLLMMSSPGGCSGHFYDAFNSRRKFFRQHAATAFDCPHISRAWIDEQIEKHGAEHPLIRSMIFGEFMNAGEDGTVIPLLFVERLLADPPDFKPGDVQAGCDFAAGGDSNCLAIREGNSVKIAACWKEADTMKTVGRFVTLFQQHELKPHQIVADEGGMGVVFCDALREAGWPVRRFNFGSASQDAAHFANAGAEIWYGFRSRIEKREVILPNDKELVAQLTSRCGWPDSKGRLQLESKADLRSRGMPSPDKADAVLLGAMVTGTGQSGLCSTITCERRGYFGDELQRIGGRNFGI